MRATSLKVFKHREAEGNSAKDWFYENAEKVLCWLESPRDWPIDQYFGILVIWNLTELSETVWESRMCVLSKGLV